MQLPFRACVASRHSGLTAAPAPWKLDLELNSTRARVSQHSARTTCRLEGVAPPACRHPRRNAQLLGLPCFVAQLATFMRCLWRRGKRVLPVVCTSVRRATCHFHAVPLEAGETRTLACPRRRRRRRKHRVAWAFPAISGRHRNEAHGGTGPDGVHEGSPSGQGPAAWPPSVWNGVVPRWFGGYGRWSIGPVWCLPR